MKNRFLSLSMAVCMICLLILTSCSAAEVPADNGGTNLDSTALTSAAQPVEAFTDVPSDAWYAEAVQYCQGKGLMAGTSNTTFAPEATLTRAMLVTILWRQAEKPVVNYLMQFSDVPEGQWYSEAVRWAASGTARPSAGRPAKRWWPAMAMAALVPMIPLPRSSWI